MKLEGLLKPSFMVGLFTDDPFLIEPDHPKYSEACLVWKDQVRRALGSGSYYRKETCPHVAEKFLGGKWRCKSCNRVSE